MAKRVDLRGILTSLPNKTRTALITRYIAILAARFAWCYGSIDLLVLVEWAKLPDSPSR